MTTIHLKGTVTESHRLEADVPESIDPGQVELFLVLPKPEEDDAGAAWADGIAHEWADDLADPRQDIYTLEDGEPVDAAR